MLGSMSITHWIVVIAVMVVLFGRNRISGLMTDVAKGIKELRHIGDDATDARRIAEDTGREITREITKETHV